MNTYLLTHNPKRSAWFDKREIQKLRRGEAVVSDWSCGHTRRIDADDRIFIIRLGEEPRGIIASGAATREPYPNKHWDPARRARGEHALYVDVCFNAILDPKSDGVLPINALRDGVLGRVHWSTQSSGIQIPDDAAAELERLWTAFLEERGIPVSPRGAVSKPQPPLGDDTGGGFRPTEENRLVEKAAEDAVTQHYRRQGWSVQSVATEKWGYDLMCRKGRQERHVEVKGVSGGIAEFVITANEDRQARLDSSWRLCVVVRATQPSRVLHEMTGAEYIAAYDLDPIAYRTRQKKPSRSV